MNATFPDFSATIPAELFAQACRGTASAPEQRLVLQNQEPIAIDSPRVDDDVAVVEEDVWVEPGEKEGAAEEKGSAAVEKAGAALVKGGEAEEEEVAVEDNEPVPEPERFVLPHQGSYAHHNLFVVHIHIYRRGLNKGKPVAEVESVVDEVLFLFVHNHLTFLTYNAGDRRRQVDTPHHQGP